MLEVTTYFGLKGHLYRILIGFASILDGLIMIISMGFIVPGFRHRATMALALSAMKRENK